MADIITPNDHTAPPKSRPGVSVITASYNYERYLGEAIDSVLAQTMPDWELIIVDDGSSDSSPDIIRQYCEKDKRIRSFHHPDNKNHGLTATLELGISVAKGTFIAFLESDDIWAPDCLEKRLELINKNGAGALFNHLQIINMTGEAVPGDMVFIESIYKNFSSKSGQLGLFETLLWQNCIPTFSCAMVKADLLHSINFDSPVARWLDWWLWIQISTQTSFVYLPEACTLWRTHKDSYNSKRRFTAYLHDANAMWKGIQKYAEAAPVFISAGYRLLLKMPFFIPLLYRIGSMLIASGPQGFINRLVSKIKRS